MDPLDLAILALRVGVVLLLYAFLFAVLRAARWSLAEDGSEGVERAALPRRRSVSQSALLEPAAVESLALRVLAGVEDSIPIGHVVAVPDGGVIGRTAEAELELPHPTVSGQHARLRLGRKGWSVEDLGSTNGTLVNGAKIRGSHAVKTGDTIGVGAVTLEVA